MIHQLPLASPAPSRLAPEQRTLFHSILRQWLTLAPAVECDQLMVARERHAPGRKCSMLALVRSCFTQPALRADLPQSLVHLLVQRQWLTPAQQRRAA
ncbi:hypothetical protein AVMA1855_22565 [Acidovorax sp. SUPP1855]|uniref:hypothetical protein n=1 Tax=Acidovorax sp. SUPP1855 TaxID=431774 RepID=UPI0023DE46CB|nr:hypothetical protein [Acidovorax sp. SUPP1855]GKS86987.1 hypothetical protein AVMA1855_22565 [Acidovorax sp. SUPP1855]